MTSDALKQLGRSVLGPPLRAETPDRVREVGRILTRRLRTLPDFLVIGAQKGGTTSVFHWLAGHPDVCRPIEKEIHFFDRHYRNGPSWYRAHFPSAARRAARSVARRRLVTGEATPYYLLHPHAARRAAELVPQARLVALLRNPADRAYSLHQHRQRIGLEDLPFDVAVEREEERLAGEVERLLADEDYESFDHREHSYLLGGRYLEQLEAWWAYFPADQLLVLRSEDLYEQPAPTFGRILDFLELTRPGDGYWYYPVNTGSYEPMDGAVRRRLLAHFEPHNRRLEERLGVDLGWSD